MSERTLSQILRSGMVGTLHDLVDKLEGITDSLELLAWKQAFNRVVDAATADIPMAGAAPVRAEAGHTRTLPVIVKPEAVPVGTDLSPDDILDAVSRAFGVSAKDIRGPGRVGDQVDARCAAAVLITELTGLSPEQVAPIINRAPLTVESYVKRGVSAQEYDTELFGKLKAVRASLARRQAA